MTAHPTAAAARLTALTAPLTRAGTGGPDDGEREKLVEQIAGWTLTVLLAMLVTRLGLM